MSERPAQAELQSAIRKLEQLGDYQSHFGANSDTVLSSEIPYYQEYNYLHRLVTTTQILVDHYNDAEWLTAHHVTNQTFKDALIEMQNAYHSCTLILGLNRTENTNKTSSISNTVASSTNQTNSSSTKPDQVFTSTTTPASQTNGSSSATLANTTTSASKNTNSSKTTNTSVKAETFTPVSNSATQVNTTEAEENITDITNTDESSAEIAVPATGSIDISSRQVSWPALFAVVIAGAVVASIAIAVIIRHEPRHSAHPRRHR